jgi:hypothetical protein
MQPSASRIDNHYSKRKPRFRRSLSDPYESQLTSGGKTALPVVKVLSGSTSAQKSLSFPAY